MIGKKFMATKMETPKETSNIASFFQRQISQVNANDTAETALNCSTVQELKAGQSVYVAVLQNSGGALNLHNAFTNFAVIQLTEGIR